jgi:hypothetical protein
MICQFFFISIAHPNTVTSTESVVCRSRLVDLLVVRFRDTINLSGVNGELRKSLSGPNDIASTHTRLLQILYKEFVSFVQTKLGKSFLRIFGIDTYLLSRSRDVKCGEIICRLAFAVQEAEKIP